MGVSVGPFFFAFFWCGCGVSNPFAASTTYGKERGSMPYRPSTPCKHPGCPKLVAYGKQYCEDHEALHRNDRDNAYKRGYNSRWQKARARYLRAHPLCVECEKAGRFVKATVVDHKVPHRGDKKLFWDEMNWQPLCKSCHDKKTWGKDNNPTYDYKF